MPVCSEMLPKSSLKIENVYDMDSRVHHGCNSCFFVCVFLFEFFVLHSCNSLLIV